MHDGQAVEVLDAGAEGDVLEEVRHEADLGHRAADILQHREHRAVLLEGKGQVDRVDAELLDDAVDVCCRSEGGHAAVALPGALRVVVHERLCAKASLRVLENLVDERMSQVARADDEDVAHADTVAGGLLEIAPDGSAAGEDEQHVRAEEEHQHDARVREVPVEGRESRQDQRREPCRDEDGQALLHPRAVPPHVVEAVEVVDDRPDGGHQRKEREVGRELGNPVSNRDDLRPEAQPVGTCQCRERRNQVRRQEGSGDVAVLADHGHRRLELTLCKASVNRFLNASGANRSAEARNEL